MCSIPEQEAARHSSAAGMQLSKPQHAGQGHEAASSWSPVNVFFEQRGGVGHRLHVTSSHWVTFTFTFTTSDYELPGHAVVHAPCVDSLIRQHTGTQMAACQRTKVGQHASQLQWRSPWKMIARTY